MSDWNPQLYRRFELSNIATWRSQAAPDLVDGMRLRSRHRRDMARLSS